MLHFKYQNFYFYFQFCGGITRSMPAKCSFEYSMVQTTSLTLASPSSSNGSSKALKKPSSRISEILAVGIFGDIDGLMIVMLMMGIRMIYNLMEFQTNFGVIDMTMTMTNLGVNTT